MLMAPPSPRLPTMETTANRVCSERNPMPHGTLSTSWQHPETRLEERIGFCGTYRAVCCVHCGSVVQVSS